MRMGQDVAFIIPASRRERSFWGQSMEYRREIDGLRAVAILPVVLFHAGIKAFEGGFVGVDVFFVISGYLITSIILTDMNKGSFSIIGFYERRARRILPALFFVMLCCLPLAWLCLFPKHLEDFCKSLISVTLFSSNILFWQQSGYFETAAELKPLLHTWSLAVEEQYYVLFPLFLMLLWKLRKRWISGSLAAVACLSLLLAQWGAHNKPSETFFLLPTRFWELAIGALIAFYLLYKREQSEIVRTNKVISEVLGWLGLALIIFSIVEFDKHTPFPSLYALLPTVGAGLVIVFSSPDTTVGRILGTKALVGAGLISYSTYLWHQPLFAFARHRSMEEPSISLLLGLSALSIIFACFSWRFIERPFRDRKSVSKGGILAFAVAGSVFFAVAGVTGYVKDGFSNRKSANGVTISDLTEKLKANVGLSKDCEAFPLSPDCKTSEEPEILVWGDSFAMHLVEGIKASNQSAKIIQMTKSVCGPFFDVAPIAAKRSVNWAEECLDFNNSVHDWLKSNSTVKYVVLSSSFKQYLGNKQLLIKDKVCDAGHELALEHFLATLDEIKNMGITPVVFSPPPNNGENIGECLARAEFFGKDLSNCSFSRDHVSETSQKAYDFLRIVSKTHKIVSLEKSMCEDGVCKASSDGVFMYRDREHLSFEGSALLGGKMNFYDLIVND